MKPFDTDTHGGLVAFTGGQKCSTALVAAVWHSVVYIETAMREGTDDEDDRLLLRCLRLHVHTVTDALAAHVECPVGK